MGLFGDSLMFGPSPNSSFSIEAKGDSYPEAFGPVFILEINNFLVLLESNNFLLIVLLIVSRFKINFFFSDSIL